MITFNIARFGASLMARQSVRLIGCLTALALTATACGTIIANMPEVSRAFSGGLPGINVSVGIGAERIGEEIVEGHLPTIIGVYHSGPLPEAVRSALDRLNNPSANVRVIYSTMTHIEQAVAAALNASGRMVGALTTRWSLCNSGQNCSAVFGYVGVAARYAGHCIYPHFPIVP